MRGKPLVVGLVLAGITVAFLTVGRDREPLAVDAAAAPPVEFRLAWAFDPPEPAGPPVSLLAVRVVLTVPNRTTLFEFDKRTGRPRWAFDSPAPLGPPGAGSPPLVTDAAGRIVSLDPDTGRVHWEQAGTFTGQPVMTVAREVFAPAGDAGLRKLGSGGEPVWAADIGALVGGRLQFDSERVYCLGRGAEPVAAAVRTDTGAVVWRTPLPLPPTDGEFWAGAELMVVPLGTPDGSAGGLIALDPATGERLWFRDLPAPPTLDPHLHRLAHPLTGERTVLLAAAGDTVHAFDARRGRAYWAARLGSPVVGSPAFVWFYVFAVTADGTLVALDNKTGAAAGACDLAPLVGMNSKVLAAEPGPNTTLVVEADAPTGRRVRVVRLEYVRGLAP